MKIGISTACFFNRAYTEDALMHIATLGARTTECFFGTRSEYVAPLIDNIATAATGLLVHSVHAMCTQFEPQLFATSPRAYADAHDVFLDLLSAAQRLHSPFYTFHGCLQLKRRAYEYDYDTIAAHMRTLTSEAKDYGVTICYENVHYSYASKPEYLRTLLSMCPDLGAVLDIKQAIQGGLTYLDFLPVIKDRLHTVHVTDMIGSTPCMPSKGDIDWHALFCDLKESNFDGTVLLEVYPTDYTDNSELRAAYDFLVEAEAKAR